MQSILLARNEFREAVFSRDKHKCVVCGAPAVDAHHIFERRLYPNGGYYLNNGASVCAVHHMECEETNISVRDIVDYAHIRYNQLPLPPGFQYDENYDKWGNVILPDGARTIGPLFWDESVQKVLAKHLHKFIKRVKYPRTPHLDWSPGRSQTEETQWDPNCFANRIVVITEKMDGECTTIYQDYLHARSLDSGPHQSRSWVANWAKSWQYQLPLGWRVCGENLYAKHSILYKDLPSYFLGFSIWNAFNVCLDWDSTLLWFELLGITPAPVLEQGLWERIVPKPEGIISKSILAPDSLEGEGFVVRVEDEFHYRDFYRSVAKWVRPNHVQTNQHWIKGPVVKNGLLGG